MKKYFIQVVSNQFWVNQLDLLQDLLNNEGWSIEQVNSTDEMIVYILSKEE